jgi:predicted O-linked N-acetylglucosamine transferase (SPINDLY family)
MQFLPNGGSDLVREEMARWNHRFVDPLRSTWRRSDNVPDPRRRLRIGYVSPSFRANAVAFFLVPLLEGHDREVCEVVCYASVRQADSVTTRLRRGANQWRDVRSWTDAQLAEGIRGDGIDILVDLAMHAGDNRLALFAHKPAPVQVSWLAYPGSTGMAAMDYRLTDAYLEPPGEGGGAIGEKLAAFGEEPVRLPDAWCCYEPIEEFPPVGPLPALANGCVTFGSLNQFNKINEDLLRCWARLLAAMPDSRLVMICPEGQAQARTRKVFSAHGITPERIECVPQRPWREYAELFTKIDIALDAFPHNGMTTTCHTLWMGVPVITRMGTTPVSRAGCSLLHAVGLPEWVAGTEEDYIRIAIEWSSDLARLANLRAGLRARMQRSPLMDVPRFARNIESAYRTMWSRWCAEHSSSRR